MPIFPFDDEEERRRRMLYLTPGVNPNEPLPSGLPEISTPSRPVLPPPSGIPGGTEMPLPRSAAPTMGEARETYLLGTPGRGKSALKGALQGFLGGGGLLGALTGGIYGAADPRGLREQEFNQRVRPRIMEETAQQAERRALERQAEQDVINNQYRRAQIGELESQAYKNRLPPPAPVPPRPITVGPGSTAVDPVTGKPIFTAPAAEPKPPAPHWARDASGNYIDLNAPEMKGRKVRGYDRPRAPKEPKAPKPGSKGSATKEQIDEAFKRAGGHAAGWTLKGMKKHFKDKGYTVPE